MGADDHHLSRLTGDVVLHGVRRAEAEIPVVLDGHPDERGERIVQLLGQLLDFDSPCHYNTGMGAVGGELPRI